MSSWLSRAKPACTGYDGLFLQRPSALGYARRSPPARAMTDYFFKDHELLVIQGEARLHGLERNNDAKTISPRLWEAKPACAGQNRVPCSRSVRDATSGARASGAPHRKRRSILAGASNRSRRASVCTLSRFRHQDDQNPTSPLVGEGGRGMRGKSELECRKSLILCRAGMNKRAGKQYHDNRLGRGADYFLHTGIPPGAGVSRRLRARADAALWRIAQKGPESGR